jgi:DNA polymerase-3 subunit gamma/tau
LRIASLSGLMPADETQLLYSLCLHGRAELGLAPDEFAALTMVLLRLLAFKPDTSAEKKTLKSAESPPVAATRSVPPAATVDAPSKPQASVHATVASAVHQPSPQVLAPAPVAAPVQSPVPDSAVVPPHTEPAPDGHSSASQANTSADPFLADWWNDQVQQLLQAQKIQAMTRELAMQSQLVSRIDHEWTLQVERESLTSGANLERLQAALHTLGHQAALKVHIGPVSDNPALRVAREQQQRMQQAEQEVMSHPLVQQLMQTFDAKIVPGSIKPLAP